MADKIILPHLQKAIYDFIEDQEGNVPRHMVLSIGSMMLILGMILTQNAYAAHRSHSSHSSHRSHSSHSSHSNSGHGSHSSHSSHSSHESHSNHSNHASHSNTHSSHSNTHSSHGNTHASHSNSAISSTTTPKTSTNEVITKSSSTPTPTPTSPMKTAGTSNSTTATTDSSSGGGSKLLLGGAAITAYGIYKHSKSKKESSSTPVRKSNQAPNHVAQQTKKTVAISPSQQKLPERTKTVSRDVIKCPKCGSKMVMRKGRYGYFYGCSRYPYCKGTRSIK